MATDGTRTPDAAWRSRRPFFLDEPEVVREQLREDAVRRQDEDASGEEAWRTATSGGGSDE